MRKIVLIAAAVLATTSAHAELSGPTMASADAAPIAQAAPAVTQPTPAAQPAPAAVQAAPAVPILQTTNPQAQMVLKQLQAHGLIKVQQQPATPPAASANVVTLPAQGQVTQGQATQGQVTQGQTTQGQTTQTQPVATASQQPVSQTVTAPVTPSASMTRPVVHVTSHRDTDEARDEAKARRIAARYGIRW